MDVGVDIEEVKRFTSLIKNSRFLKRVFTDDEIRYCRSKKNKAQHFAVRFAAKEAAWKALSDVMRRRNATLSHRDIGLRNQATGKPEMVLQGALASWSKRLSVSLSHTKNYAVAVVLVKGS